jgi:hypothetical protein
VSFAGWTLSQLGVLFAIGGGAITLLYLLRMRRRQVVVPFAALWERVARESESRQLWRRLRRLLSWLLQMLVLALVCAALGDPRPEVWLREPRSVAIVIDRSASMAGIDDTGERTRLQAAQARARAEVAGMGPADRAVIVAAGVEVSIAAPLSGDSFVLLPAIDDLTPSAGQADMQRAIALATHAVSHREGGRILVLTDGALGPAGADAVRACTEAALPCTLASIEGPPVNVAITAFAARRYPDARDKFEVLTEVRNLGAETTAVVLDVEAEGVSVGRRELVLEPGAVKREILADLDAARTRLVARLSAPRSAPVGVSTDLGPSDDDIAYAIVPPLRPLEVALVTDGTNLFLEAALLTLEDHVRLTGVTPADARAWADARISGGPSDTGHALDEADLAVFDVADDALPAMLPEAHLVLFDPWRNETSPSPIGKGKDVTRPFLTEQARKHAILDHIVLKDVNVARGTTFVTQPGDTVLVRSLGDPMVVLREQTHSTLVFGFDPRQSDLVLRPALPLLVENIVRYIEQREPGFVASVPLGEGRELSIASLGLPHEGVSRVIVDGPGLSEAGMELPVERGRFRLRALLPGFYGVTSLDGDMAGARVELAVNQASVDASDPHARLHAVPDTAQAGPPPDPAPLSQGPLWSVLLLVVTGLIVFEWVTYHRRVTV